MLQTWAASSQASALERCSLGKSARGAYAHQPTGSPSMNASTPRDAPPSTSSRWRRFMRGPFATLMRSEGASRHHMHQHPAQAPLGPNSFSISGHSSGVRSRVSIFTARLR